MSEIPAQQTAPVPPATPAAQEHKPVNYGAIFWLLLFLTIFEIIAANFPLPKPVIVVSLVALALVKAALVALFYMHLKFEKYIFYIIVAFPLMLAVILVLMVLWDSPTIK